MATQNLKHRIKVIGLALMLGLSIASFTYLTSINHSVNTAPEDIYVEEIDEERGELLPDVQLIKMLMNKTIDFVTQTPRF